MYKTLNVQQVMYNTLDVQQMNIQHLEYTTHEYTTTWMYNTLNIQHLECTTLECTTQTLFCFYFIKRGGGRHYSLHNSCLPIKFTNPSISQSRLYSSLSFIRLILTNTQVSSTLVFPDSFLQSHKFTKGNKIRMKF